METAVQDVIGGTLLLIFSAWMLSTFGDFGVGCPGGDLSGCVASCFLSDDAVNGTYTPVNATCLHECVKFDAAGVC